MERSKEIRAILSGRIAFHEGAYIAAPNLRSVRFIGLNDGSNAVTLFGVAKKCRSYSAESMDAAVIGMGRIFAQLGRPVYFESDPELPARLIRVFGNPVILVMDYVDDSIVVSANTARKVFAFLTLNRAFHYLERHFPEDVRLDFISENLPQETMRQRRIRKKAGKLARKAKRYEAKARTLGGGSSEE